jgi:hypothetical protein
MKLNRDILYIGLTLLLAGCSNPLNYRVSKLTRDQNAMLHRVLTADQSAELDAWIQRHTATGERLPAGVTVDKALKDQEDWLAKQQAEKTKVAELQKQRMRDLAAKQQQLASLISVALLSKTNKVLPDDRKFVALDLEYANKTDKDIQAVKGTVSLVNVYGEPVIAFDWAYNRPISSKHTVVQHNAGMFISASVDPQVELWDTDYNKLKFTFEIKTIMFKDGTSIGGS